MGAHAVVTARFDDVHSVVGAVRSLRQDGHEDVRVFGPVMEPDLEDALDKPASPVRRYALIGGITGCISGFALPIWSSYSYPLVVGGKPLSSIPAYVIIGFELTILFAGISALIGMMIHSLMPTMKLPSGYDPRFSDDLFGVRVVCQSGRSSSVEQVLRSHGSSEVHVEG